MLRRLERGLLLVVSSNLIFFSQRHRQPALAYPCLAAELPGAGPPDSSYKKLEQKLLAASTAHLYLLQQRRRIAEALFGGPPRLALRERLQLFYHGLRAQRATAPGADDRPWSERGLLAAQFATSYDFVPLDSPEAENWRWTRELASWLSGRLPALAILVPQNHWLLGPLAEGPAYDGLAARIAGAFAAAGVPFVSYDRDPALQSAHFLDLDHLTAAGNQVLAARLAADLVPRLRAAQAR
jgi:hypothetical protein